MRLIILTLAVSFLMYPAFAQEWNVGVKGGINISSASLANSDNEMGSIVGLHFGGFANTMVTSQVAIQPEVMFSLQGWENGNNYNMSYLQVPVVLKYFLVDRFNIHAGPQIGFLMGEEDALEGRIKSTDFSFALGGEYNINERFGAVVRYNWGLKNFREDLESSGDVKFRSRVLQITASYQLNR